MISIAEICLLQGFEERGPQRRGWAYTALVRRCVLTNVIAGVIPMGREGPPLTYLLGVMVYMFIL